MSSLPKISVGGDFFLAGPGVEFFYVGYSDFGQYKRFCIPSGPENLVRPLLRERREIADRVGYTGPLVMRTFRCSDPGNPFGQLPSQVRFDLINSFLDMCAEYNTYVDFTQGDDDHSMMFGPSLTGLQAFHNNFTSFIQRFCFYETENEPFKNGHAPENGIIPPPSEWYLRDSGYYKFIGSEFWDTRYNLEFVSFHGTRDGNPQRWPKWVIDLDDSISTLRSVLNKPSVLKEPNKFGPYYNDPSYAKILGLRANMGGVVFHSQLGLESNGFDDATKAAFGQFCIGVKGALA